MGKRRKFSREFKEEAVRHLGLGVSAAEVAKACEVNANESSSTSKGSLPMSRCRPRRFPDERTSHRDRRHFGGFGSRAGGHGHQRPLVAIYQTHCLQPCNSVTGVTLQVPFILETNAGAEGDPAPQLRISQSGTPVGSVALRAVSDSVHVINTCDDSQVDVSAATSVPEDVCACCNGRGHPQQLV